MPNSSRAALLTNTTTPQFNLSTHLSDELVHLVLIKVVVFVSGELVHLVLIQCHVMPLGYYSNLPTNDSNQKTRQGAQEACQVGRPVPLMPLGKNGMDHLRQPKGCVH